MSLIEDLKSVCDSYEFMGSDPVVTEHTYHQEIIGRRAGWVDEFALISQDLPAEDGTQEYHLFVHHAINRDTGAVAHQHSHYVHGTDGRLDLLMYVHEFANNWPDTHNTGVEFRE